MKLPCFPLLSRRLWRRDRRGLSGGRPPGYIRVLAEHGVSSVFFRQHVLLGNNSITNHHRNPGGTQCRNNDTKNATTPQLYTFDVSLISGPLSEKFIKKNPVVARTIEIGGDQTFADLHRAIFNAYDREEEHMYEFQIGGKGPQDPNARCYVSDPENADAAGYAGDTRIDAVGLQDEEAFGYWFDYGDDWWHQVNVVSISPDVPKGRYPKVTKKVGASPPQYSDEL